MNKSRPTFSVLTAAMALAALPLLGETPKDPKSPVAGFADGKGPTGPVTLKMISPKQDEVLPIPDGAKGARVEVKVELTGIELFKDEATKSAQAITLILNNQAKSFDITEVGKPFVFPSLPKGTHTLRAIVTRPWGETIKEPAAFSQITFHVGEKDGKNTPVTDLPVLTVVRPDAKIPKAKAEKIVIDTHVAGCEIAPESVESSCRLIYRLNQDPEVTIEKWEPITLTGVPVGKHSFTVGLRRSGKFFDNDKFALLSFWFEVTEGEAAAAAAPGVPPSAPAPAAAAAPK